MALINCPECNKEVSDKALNCPNCGNPITEVESYNVNNYETKSNSGGGCLKNILVAIIIIIVGVTLVNLFTDDKGSTSNVSEHSELLAYSYAMDCVKSRLKSPSTAEFPSSIEKKQSTKSSSYGVYVIKSWVDSQNSFGAMIRSNFECTVKFDGDKVRCESVIIY